MSTHTPLIRRGIASRLGLRTPYNRPPMPLMFPRALSEAEVERFIARFQAADYPDRFKTLLLDPGATLTRKPFPERRSWSVDPQSVR